MATATKKGTIRLKQVSVNKQGEQEYRVKSTSNTTNPKVGKRFTEREVNKLMEEYTISISE